MYMHIKVSQHNIAAKKFNERELEIIYIYGSKHYLETKLRSGFDDLRS